MVVVVAIQGLNVQRQLPVHCEGGKELAYELGVERADLWRREFGPEHQEGTAGDIERDAGQCPVHRQQAVGVTGDAGLGAERLQQRLPERDADVLDRVVIVDVQVALGFDLHGDAGVARQLVEHVVEEADPGGHAARAAAVQIDGDGDRRFVRGSHDAGVSRRGRLCH